MIIKRIIQEPIEKDLFGGKAIIIYGARQVGKTTLVKQIQKKYLNESLYINCDEPDVQQSLTGKTSTELFHFFQGKRLIIIDEAQRVENIGMTLKLIVDNYPGIQVVATGSSSFELSNKIVEPLTGRAIEYTLYPFSVEELQTIYDPIEMKRLLETRMLFGSYPAMVMGEKNRERTLITLANNYTHKDILQYHNIKNPEVLIKLLQALALQIGNEVSYNELASLVGIDKVTVASYIQLLEKAFIIFRLNPFSRNLRNELKKMRKIYFYDTGIRNALINNFNTLDIRQDVGALWENYVISERIKSNNNHFQNKNMYFWRTWDQKEIDLVEERGGVLSAFEVKWKVKKSKVPKDFLDAYQNSNFILINRDNFLDIFHN
ncbi:MAG: ATP-binding protein [Parcubacteria group bacterium]|jgi:hypothetical protein